VTPELAEMKCCYSNFMQRVATKVSFNPKLAWYVLNNDLARNQFDLLSNSTTGLANLNGTMIGQLLLTMPPSQEQVDMHFLSFRMNLPFLKTYTKQLASRVVVSLKVELLA